MIKAIKKLLIVLFAIAIVLPICSCTNNKQKDSSSLRIGMVVGGIFDQYIPAIYPGASIEYFYSASDLPLALDSGKIDLYIDDEFSAKEHCIEYTEQKIDRIIHDDEYGFIFNKNKEELRNQMNVFLKELETDGRLSKLQDIWLYGDDETLKVINYDELTDTNGVLKVGIVSTMPPVNYVKDGQYVGYELAIIEQFCKEHGYGIEFQSSDFSSTMSSITVDACDIGAGSYSITEERKQSLLFSEPYMTAHCVAVVRNIDASINAKDDTSNKQKVAVVIGALFDVAVKEDDPNAEIEYYNLTSDLPIALENEKVDTYSVDEPVARMLCNLYEDHYIDKKLTVENYGIVINKNKPEIQTQFNEYIAKLKENGDLLKMQEAWMGTDESKKVIDFDSLVNNTKTLKLATTSSMQPFDYIKDGKYAGYEIAIVASFCKEYGYNLQIEDTSFSSVIASVSSGKTDLGCCVITINDERKETMNFTDSIYEGGIVNVKKRKGDTKYVYTLDDLAGKTIGSQVGATYDLYVGEKIKNPIFQYYNFVSDMNVALDSNKISAYIVDKPVADTIINQEPGKYRILDSIKKISYGIVFPKSKENSKKLCNEFNKFLKECKSNGVLDEIYDIWTGNDESKKFVDKKGLTGENGTIVCGVSSNVGIPFASIKNNELVGCDIDIIYRFCREYGYDLSVTDYSIDGMFTTLSTGNCDIGASGICITEERKESMYFSDPYYESDCAIVVKEYKTISDTDKEKNFFASIVNSFNKTFIKEDRWKLFVSGILATIVVTLLSIIFGSLLGFVMYMMYRDFGLKGKRIINAITNIIQKTPVVVILMIFYYIIFGGFEISGITVSVIGLSILFASAVKGLILMGVNSIDKGQIEAAYTLGYSKNQAFIQIIFPQAVMNVISGYKSSIISLIKDSAIVGYIAVQDLTKVSDIIRSRTYEAFFPLIATAVIYYLIATLFVYIVSKFEVKIDPKKRTEIPILKGVKINDKN